MKLDRAHSKEKSKMRTVRPHFDGTRKGNVQEEEHRLHGEEL